MRFIIIFILCLIQRDLDARIPRLINYQGKLRESGVPVNGYKNIIFRIYDSGTGGSLIWAGDAQNVRLTNGLFSTRIGESTAPFSPVPFSNINWGAGDRFLEIQIDLDVLEPREQLTSAAYAFFAGNIEDNSVSTIKIANGTIQSEDIGFNQVTHDRISALGWGKITNIPSGFADNTDNTSEGPAGGDLQGFYPNPSIKDKVITTNKLADPLRRFLVPAGVILMWSGSIGSIPAGWVLCDGSNGTPDLRNRFIVCAGGGYGVGDRGGTNYVTLTENQLPSHTHSGSVSADGAHTHALQIVSDGSHAHTCSLKAQWDQAAHGGDKSFVDPGSGGSYNPPTSSAGAHNHGGSTALSGGSHTHTITIGNTGLSQAHENRPPFFALAYIMKKFE